MSDFCSDLSLTDLPFGSHGLLIFPSNRLMWKQFLNVAQLIATYLIGNTLFRTVYAMSFSRVVTLHGRAHQATSTVFRVQVPGSAEVTCTQSVPFSVSAYSSTPWSMCVCMKGTDTPQFLILMFEVHTERGGCKTVSKSQLTLTCFGSQIAIS